VIVDVLGLTIVLPILPFYAGRFGASPEMIGILYASYSIFQLFSGPILGGLSDRIGRRPVLLFSQVGTLLGFLLMAKAPSLLWLFLGRILDGMTAGNLTVAQACIVDLTEPKYRTKAFAIIGIAFGLGFLLGPAFGGILSSYGMHAPFYLAAALSGLSILGTLFLLKESRRDFGNSETRKILDLLALQTSFSDPKLKGLLIQFAGFSVAFSIFFTGFGVFAERTLRTSGGQPWGAREVGYLFAYTGLLGLLAQGGLVGRLSQRWGDGFLIRLGFALQMLGYLMLGFSRDLPLLLAAASFSSFGHAFVRPALMSQISKRSSDTQQGAVLGVVQSLNSLSQIGSPLVAGVLLGQNSVLIWAACCAILSGFGLWVALKSEAENGVAPAG
jgi:MFS family permease